MLRGAAGGESIRCLMETNGIFGLEMFALLATAIGLNEQLRGRGLPCFLDNNAAVGALLGSSSGAPVVPALIESFCGCVAQLPASCRAEGVSSGANPADAPSRTWPLL